MRHQLHCLFAAACATSLSAQATDWYESPVNGHLYKLTDPKSWHDAEAEAVSTGGHLATVRNAEELSWLLQTFGARHMWIGLHDSNTEGQFEWSSGEPVTFTHWCTGEPSGSPADEDFVHIAEYPGWCSGGWNDQQATDLFAGIVERRPYVWKNSPSDPVHTLREAYELAQEGDIIDAGAYGYYPGDPGDIRKSVTIMNADWGYAGGVTIYGGSPHVPLRLIDCVVSAYRYYPAVAADISAHKIELIRFHADRNESDSYEGYDYSEPLVYLSGNIDAIDCSFEAGYALDNAACREIGHIVDGQDAIHLYGTLNLFNSSVTAGRGMSLWYSCCYGTPPNCYEQWTGSDYGGNGGAAITGGAVANFGSSIVDGYEGCWIYCGNPGQSTYTDVTAGPWRLGASTVALRGMSAIFHVRLDQGEVGYLCVGLPQSPLPTPLGDLFMRPLNVWSTASGQVHAIPVPNAQQFVGVEIVGQILRVQPTPALSNPARIRVY